MTKTIKSKGSKPTKISEAIAEFVNWYDGTKPDEAIGFTARGKLAHSKAGIVRFITLRESAEIMARLSYESSNHPVEDCPDENWYDEARTRWLKMVAAALR